MTISVAWDAKLKIRHTLIHVNTGGLGFFDEGSPKSRRGSTSPLKGHLYKITRGEALISFMGSNRTLSFCSGSVTNTKDDRNMKQKQ